LDDIVVDTNVFVHAGTPEMELWQKPSLEFLTALLGCTTKLCVDEGFSLDESSNRSLMGLEFLENLQYGSPGMNIIVALAGAERIKFLPSKVETGIAKKINQAVKNKKTGLSSKSHSTQSTRH